VDVTATYFTDPMDPWGWAAEPARRRLEVEFAGQVQITCVMVGLVRRTDEERLRRLALSTLDAAAESGMPADARVWLRDPPASSYPASIAVHAVSEQTDPGPYVRRLREAVFAERRRIDTPEALIEVARELGGIDLARLRIDLGSHAPLERFGADLELARAAEHVTERPDPEDPRRIAIPSVRFEGPGGQAWATGTWRWEDWRAAAVRAGAGPAADALPSVEEAVRRFGAMATAEVATVCGLPLPRAAAELWRLALEWRVTPRRLAGGELWSPAG
jgi:predicted DsbA family dithiol-disulfide isomerase